MKSEQMNDKILDFTIQISTYINFPDQDLKAEGSFNNLDNIEESIDLI